MPDTHTTDALRTRFIEQTGLSLQAEGLPRIAGRVLGMLIFDGERVAFGDLATQLQVSRGSISSSIRLLEERGLVKRTTEPGVRQDFFQLADNPYATMLAGIQQRQRSRRDEIAKTINLLPEESDAIGRLRAHAQFYASIDAAMGVALAQLNASEETYVGQQPVKPGE
ncbi:MarR family transcriptional regulator [Loktanella sp. SALINAS62]|uniref:GbsR/MarR family transcriptional regulator n=1 Tax=Loktanella sp. SALINAS62 TaxID=2706124 RepID=UPI001B8D7978|nr:MarR family transcriptional regulator [Loktanella sp. SALINAS62]MBS1301159.1 MarR family transcriptional regulator [Loktanella sp. SALINAS62]